MNNSHFCPCTDYECDFNPINHDKGCSLCVEDRFKTKEIPKCFFISTIDDIDSIEDWSFEAFAKIVLSNK